MFILGTGCRVQVAWCRLLVARSWVLVFGSKLTITLHLNNAGLKAFREAMEKPELIYDNRSDGDPVIPDDLMDAFNKNDKAYENFNCFPQSSRRIYIEWLNSAKRSETRPRRIEKIVGFCEKNIKPGMTL